MNLEIETETSGAPAGRVYVVVVATSIILDTSIVAILATTSYYTSTSSCDCNNS